MSANAQIGKYRLLERIGDLHTVKTMLGRDFNLDVQLAWTQIYNFIAETMIEAAAAEV